MKRSYIQDMVITALFAALLCVLCPLSVPISSIPITLQLFAIMLTVYLIGTVKGLIALVIYLVLGIVGVPVFAGYSSGFGVIAGPTGGYIVGFLLTVVICGLFFKHFPIVDSKGTKAKAICCILDFIGMVLGVLVCYIFGTAWFCIQASYSVGAALAVCVVPYIPFDLLKCAAVLLIAPPVLMALKKAKLM